MNRVDRTILLVLAVVAAMVTWYVIATGWGRTIQLEPERESHTESRAEYEAPIAQSEIPARVTVDSADVSEVQPVHEPEVIAEDLAELWNFVPPSLEDVFPYTMPASGYRPELFQPVSEGQIALFGGPPTTLDDLHRFLLDMHIPSPERMAQLVLSDYAAPSVDTVRLRNAEDSRLNAAEVVEASYRDAVDAIARELRSEIEADYWSFLSRREYVVIAHGSQPPPVRRLSPLAVPGYLAVPGRWYVDASFDPTRCAGLQLRLPELNELRRQRNASIKAIIDAR
jgi:hypothetical protein